jgi:hypothetical protein
MAKKGLFKKVLLSLVLAALLIIVFVLLGGGDFLRTAGKKMEGAGRQADQIKQTVEEKAASVEKTVEKGLDSIKSGEKK